MDVTEGLNAFLSLSDSYTIGPKNFDIGGDPFSTPLINFLLDISNTVYNPYIPLYNILSDRKYDTVTSFSVLNVLVKKAPNGQYLFDKEAARCHIELCIWSLIPYEGRVYIKVYEGDRRGIPGKKPHEKYIQTNMHWLKYHSLIFDICDENWCELYVDYVKQTYIIAQY